MKQAEGCKTLQPFLLQVRRATLLIMSHSFLKRFSFSARFYDEDKTGYMVKGYWNVLAELKYKEQGSLLCSTMSSLPIALKFVKVSVGDLSGKAKGTTNTMQISYSVGYWDALVPPQHKAW